MSRAFIIRPFGVKQGIDFDAVESELIGPALDALDIGGRTTGDILEAGNIREDMFRLLLTADLVVADISIGNPNVYYELGIRHALRNRHTFLIRSRALEPETGKPAVGSEVPFDLKTDRYFAYDNQTPASSLEFLTKALKATLASDPTDGADSPVFKLLPGLGVGDWIKFLRVPQSFREAARRAEHEGWIGDLLLLADEAERCPWSFEGLRIVGQALLDLRYWHGARLLWEKVRARSPEDAMASGHLATIHQKMDDLTRSDEAVDHLLRIPDLSRHKRAEAWALRGSNAKTRWLAEWRAAEPAGREAVALRSPELATARDHYRTGFLTDQNHSYSGLNTLALLQVSRELALRHGSVWNLLYESDEEAKKALSELELEVDRISQSLHLSLAGDERALRERALRPDADPEAIDDERQWLELTKAELRLLTQDSPERVAQGYRGALQGAQAFNADSLLRQLRMYVDLDVRKDNADAVIAFIEAEEPKESGEQVGASCRRVLVFSGHRLDVEGRESSRFPDTPEAISKARSLIHDAVAAEVAKAEGEPVAGLAGGASGGDILFHEVCAELGVQTHMYLLADRDSFVKSSVADAGPDWIERFDKLHAGLPGRVLQEGSAALELPNWLQPLQSEYSIWQRNNHWLLSTALAHGAERAVVIALWDGKEVGDGEGGTSHMVEIARDRGCPIIHLDALKLL